ncbi:unnamed protein product [Orchesella dallaii]
MIVEHTELFQAWLSQVLRPLCDAEPGALAKYVLALIKKDKTEKELRQSMVDQLDVFLQSETKPFVEKLFEALNNKEYLNAKPSEPVQSKSESIEKGNNGEAVSGAKVEKSGSASETEPTSSTSGPTAAVNSSTHTSSSGNEGSSKKGSNTLSVTPSALLNAGSTEATSHHKDSTENKEDSKSRRDRRDVSHNTKDDRDKRRKRSRTDRDRRASRSRSNDRTKRSRSPRLERDRERDRDRNERLRHRPRKSPPPRRYERDVWDRRRSRSPIRNRSASPRNRSRTPPRYRRPFNSSRSRSRSPIVRDRSRSRSRSRSPAKDKKDSLLPLPLAHPDPDSLSSKEMTDKPIVQSVVVRPGAPQPENSDMKPGYNAVPQAPGVTGNRCRDFDEKGLCMRGELCPFDHGKDPVVLEDIVVPASGGAGNYGGRGIVPGAGPGYTAPLVRPSIIGEYYPDSPSIETPVGWGPGAPPFRPRHLARGRGGLLLRPQAMGPYPVPGQRQLISVPVVGVPPAVPVMGDLRGPHPQMPPMQMHPMRGVHGMRGRGRGGFDHGRLGAKPPRNYTNCSLEVRKIPREQNTIMDLNSHFIRFGKIINIQINYDNDPEAALVTFSSPAEAQLAYRSTEAVLNNRFIRVFWHNKEKENEEEAEASNPPRIPVKDRLGAQQDPMDDRRHEHEKILISGNNLTKTVYNNALLAKKMETPQEKLQAVEAIRKSQELLAAQENLKKLQEQKKQEVLKMSNDLRKRKQTMMEEQIEQQKKLIAKFEHSKDRMKPEEKDSLLGIIKSLQESVERLKRDLDESNPNISKQPGFQGLKSKEEAQKEMLDAELDLYNKEQQGGDTVDLQKKVLELRARAKSLGLIGSPGVRGGGGGGRGTFRGAGRGGFRGRGIIRGRGRLRALRSVDRRPTKIRVTGCPAPRLPELLDHFSVYGQIRDYEPDCRVPMMIIEFECRKTAEVAMTNGQMFDDIKLTLEWVTENNTDGKLLQAENSNNGETSNHDDLDNSASLDEDEEELGDILNSEIMLTGEDDDEDDEDRSWRR